MKPAHLLAVALTGLLLACAPTPRPTPAPTPTPVPIPEIFSPTGYRPLQQGDGVEGATISYQYVLPSLERPVVTLAFGSSLMQLVTPKQELVAGLVSYIEGLQREPRKVYAFDEGDPAQTEPKLLALDMSKPVEIAIVGVTAGSHTWSVTESQDGEVRAGYKLVRRKDGGLRFVDAYEPTALGSFSILATRNGTGAGLVFSARLALLSVILSNEAYQRGQDVMAKQPPQPSQYDARILKLDPSRTGLDQNVDWALVSRPGPNPGMIGG